MLKAKQSITFYMFHLLELDLIR